MIPREKLIAALRKELKGSPIARRLCDKYDESPDFIDRIPIQFAPLDVSAKTVEGKVLLNSKLLEGDFRDDMRYLVHEFTHCLQQEHGKVDDSAKDKDYLDDPNEEEAFKAQIDFMETTYSPKEIQEYLDGLVRHHGLEGEEKEKKIEELKK